VFFQVMPRLAPEAMNKHHRSAFALHIEGDGGAVLCGDEFGHGG